MRCTLVPTHYVVRWHEDDLPDDQQITFLASASASVDDEMLCCLQGFKMADFSEEARDAAYAALRQVGVKRILYTRRKRVDGKVIKIVVNRSIV